jgi:outer membrane protein assembly factor BamB
VADYVCPAVIAHEGVVYIAGGRKPQTFAIRAGGRGDVTETHTLWEARKSTKVPTPLYYDGRLYWINEKGIATCLDAKTGEVVYEERLKIEGRGDKVYASAVLADGKLYYVTRQGGTIVLGAGPEFHELARNDLGDQSIFNATPVVSNGQLLIRSDRFLYCIGK